MDSYSKDLQDDIDDFAELTAKHEQFLMSSRLNALDDEPLNSRPSGSLNPSFGSGWTFSGQNESMHRAYERQGVNMLNMLDDDDDQVLTQMNNQYSFDDEDDAGDSLDLSSVLRSMVTNPRVDQFAANPQAFVDTYNNQSVNRYDSVVDDLDDSTVTSVLAALDDENENELDAHKPLEQSNNQSVEQLIDQNQPGAAVSQQTPIQSTSSLIQSPQQPPATVNVPLPPDFGQSANAAPVYIPLPARHCLFMNKSEQALVIKLQLSQLQNQSSEITADNYYSQVWEWRKGGKISPMLKHLPPVLPKKPVNQSSSQSNNSSAPTIRRNADGSLSFDERTLGKIATSSLRKPKKFMEIQSQSDDQAIDENVDQSNYQPRRRLFGSSRAVAYLIEEGFFAVIALEEADAALRAFHAVDPAAPEDPQTINQRQQLLQHRHDCMMLLLDQLDMIDVPPMATHPMTGYLQPSATHTGHLLHTLYKLPKGRLLLFRSLLLLQPPFTFQILSVMMSSMSAFAHVDGHDKHDDHLAQLSADIVYGMGFNMAVGLFSLLVSEQNLPQFISNTRSKIGCMLMQVFMKKGLDVYEMAMKTTNGAFQWASDPSLLAWRAIALQLLTSVQDWRSLVTDLQLPVSLIQARLVAQGKKAEAARPERTSICSSAAAWELAAQFLSFLTLPEMPNGHVLIETMRSQLTSEFEAELTRIYLTESPTVPAAQPVLLPPISPAFAFLSRTLFGEDQSLLGQCDAKQKQSAAAVQEFIRIQQQKQAELQHKMTHQPRPRSYNYHAQQAQRGHHQQQHRQAPSQPRPTVAAQPQRSAPGSYAFIAATKAKQAAAAKPAPVHNVTAILQRPPAATTAPTSAQTGETKQ